MDVPNNVSLEQIKSSLNSISLPLEDNSTQILSVDITTKIPQLYEYVIDIGLTSTSGEIVDALRNVLSLSDLYYSDDKITITDVNMTTVCYTNNTRTQCRCENQYAWAYNTCVTYGTCDAISSNKCGCINAIPPNGQFCLPNGEIPQLYEYVIDIGLTSTSGEIVNALRNVLSLSDLYYSDDKITITDVNMTTVCYTNNTRTQCRCENQYAWAYNTCVTYGTCDAISSNKCGCINAIPPNGQFCLPNGEIPQLYEYVIDIVLTSTSGEIVDALRNVLSLSDLYYSDDKITITDVNMTTVCYTNNTRTQCRCENQYAWAYNTCVTYGTCDAISSNKCGCINAIPPNGQFCLPNGEIPQLYEYVIDIVLTSTSGEIVDALRNVLSLSDLYYSDDKITITDVNMTTEIPQLYEYVIDIVLTSTSGEIVDALRNVLSLSDLYYSDDKITITDVNMTTEIPQLYEYVIDIGLTSTSGEIVNALRNVLSLSDLYYSDDKITITDVNMTTVCYTNNTRTQCRCENQYAWAYNTCNLMWLEI
ncbi:uncharacterized protein LOC114763641 [Denticeps clupeoides]|uniref:uncharacterized protein LOC114763641 n=1 Tax=Denticeps clupeoides TaxID=299321 RepID=UPI0010A576C4|nr:uncharacterized protein LOC114763641 [Denticeps clupeoides]